MGFDLRRPLGAMFTVLGLLLAVFGLLSDRELYQRTYGINVNLVWGSVLLVFGGMMLWFGRSRRADDHPKLEGRGLDAPAPSR